MGHFTIKIDLTTSSQDDHPHRLVFENVNKKHNHHDRNVLFKNRYGKNAMFRLYMTCVRYLFELMVKELQFLDILRHSKS